MLRDLFVLKGDKELSFGERKMLDTARNLLVKELSIARSHSEEKSWKSCAIFSPTEFLIHSKFIGFIGAESNLSALSFSRTPICM